MALYLVSVMGNKLLLLFLYSVSFVTAQDSRACFWPNGSTTASTNNKIYACSDTGESPCCNEGEVCLSNNLCFSPSEGMVRLSDSSRPPRRSLLMLATNRCNRPDISGRMHRTRLEDCRVPSVLHKQSPRRMGAAVGVRLRGRERMATLVRRLHKQSGQHMLGRGHDRHVPGLANCHREARGGQQRRGYIV